VAIATKVIILAERDIPPLQTHSSKVAWVGAPSKFGEVDAEHLAQRRDVVGRDLSAPRLQVTDGGPGPSEVLPELLLRPTSTRTLAADVRRDNVAEAGHAHRLREYAAPCIPQSA
jgi:hypothetical protein